MQEILHATSVAVVGRGLLIRGGSGRGKSGLALELMVRGATLIADDRTLVTRREEGLFLSAPDALRGLIEARGLGILTAETADDVPLAAVVDLDVTETHRLPPMRTTRLLGIDAPLLHKSASEYFPAGLVQYLKGSRRD